MLSRFEVLTALTVVAFSHVLPASASPARTLTANQRHSYYLMQVRVADASPDTYLWEVRQMAEPNGSDADPPLEVFPSLASPDLRKWVSRLPVHSAIFYTVGIEQALIRGDADKVMAAAEGQTDDFSRFCRSRGVMFDLCSVAD